MHFYGRLNKPFYYAPKSARNNRSIYEKSHPIVSMFDENNPQSLLNLNCAKG